MSLLIKNGRIITAVDDYHADIFIENETVALIGKELKIDADNVVDAKGKYVFPGGIDPHTHLDMPFGGTVSSQGQSPLEGLDIWQAKADGKTAIDYGFHMIITDMPDRYLTDLKVLIDRCVTSYKLFTAYPGVLYMSDGMIFNTMRKAGEMGAMISVHAENGIVIDEIVKLAIAEGKTSPKPW